MNAESTARIRKPGPGDIKATRRRRDPGDQIVATGEFEIIDRYFARHALQRPDVDLGIGDDAAIVRVPQDKRLVVTVDTIVDGVHFPTDTGARDIGYRALAVNLSDLAAMGAEPAWAVMALTIPDLNEAWLDQFAEGFAELARTSNIALIGGDLNHGPLSVTVTVHGILPADAGLTRSGASAGDVLFVTGTLGAAACGLKTLTGSVADKGDRDSSRVVANFLKPQPRLREGRDLLLLASAAIDISDGLVIDIGRLAAASSVSASLDADSIPVSDSVVTLCGDDAALQFALSGGDDYELCFAVPPDKVDKLSRVSSGWSCGCTRVGNLDDGQGVHIWRDGAPVSVDRPGYDHFADGGR